MLAAYSPLGQVGYVSAQYLSAYTTMQLAGRVIRSPGGTIYFTDAGLKLPFTVVRAGRRLRRQVRRDGLRAADG